MEIQMKEFKLIEKTDSEKLEFYDFWKKEGSLLLPELKELVASSKDLIIWEIVNVNGAPKVYIVTQYVKEDASVWVYLPEFKDIDYQDIVDVVKKTMQQKYKENTKIAIETTKNKLPKLTITENVTSIATTLQLYIENFMVAIELVLQEENNDAKSDIKSFESAFLSNEMPYQIYNLVQAGMEVGYLKALLHEQENNQSVLIVFDFYLKTPLIQSVPKVLNPLFHQFGSIPLIVSGLPEENILIEYLKETEYQKIQNKFVYM